MLLFSTLFTHTLTVTEITISRLVWNYHCLSTASYDGVLLWCLKDYQLHKRNEKTRSLYSQPFYTSRYGYRMCARVYLNGEGQGQGNYVSLFFVLMQGDYDDLLPWPFRQTVTLSLVNQDGGANKRDHSETFRPDPASSSFEKPKTSMNIATGSPLFIRHDALENRASPYLKNDTLYFRVSVDVRGINAGWTSLMRIESWFCVYSPIRFFAGGFNLLDVWSWLTYFNQGRWYPSFTPKIRIRLL